MKGRAIAKILLSLTLLIGLLPFANAGRYRTEAIKLNGLDEFRGKMVTAYYVSGRPAVFGMRRTFPYVRCVIHKSEPLPIHGNGRPVVVPPARFFSEGSNGFKYVVFVVHTPYVDMPVLTNETEKGEEIPKKCDFYTEEQINNEDNYKYHSMWAKDYRKLREQKTNEGISITLDRNALRNYKTRF